MVNTSSTSRSPSASRLNTRLQTHVPVSVMEPPHTPPATALLLSEALRSTPHTTPTAAGDAHMVNIPFEVVHNTGESTGATLTPQGSSRFTHRDSQPLSALLSPTNDRRLATLVSPPVPASPTPFRAPQAFSPSQSVSSHRLQWGALEPIIRAERLGAHRFESRALLPIVESGTSSALH